MYAFAQRDDTKVFDEPLYAHYLKNHPEAHSYHPGADDILNTMENDGDKVVAAMLNTNEKPVVFFKHMTHHLLDLDREFMTDTINIILTRNPKEMLPSFDKVIANPTMDDVGYALHINLLNYFNTHKIPFAVLDSKSVLLNPEKILSKLCDFIEIPFDKKMLSWEPQQRLEDGVWAKYWYKSVHQSSGFMKYKPKDEVFPERLNTLLNECLTHYKTLLTYSI